MNTMAVEIEASACQKPVDGDIWQKSISYVQKQLYNARNDSFTHCQSTIILVVIGCSLLQDMYDTCQLHRTHITTVLFRICISMPRCEFRIDVSVLRQIDDSLSGMVGL